MPGNDSAIPIVPFEPRSTLRNGHWMTLYSWGNPRYFPSLPEPVRRYFDVAPGNRVLAHCHWHEYPQSHTTLILLHGLNGSSHAHYMRGIANKAYARGMNVVRLNQRNCGDTEHLSEGLFHSGLTGDVHSVVVELMDVDGLDAIGIAGYSLGGNLALKLAGEYGAEPPHAVRSIAAVSPILEIAECVDALERPANAIYQWNFVRDLKRRIRRKARVQPGRFDLARLARVRTVREFDEAFTAPAFGFHGASDYYHRASAMRVIDAVRLPTLIITAEDDPFVPPGPFRQACVATHPYIDLRLSRHGGHCGFVGAATPGGDGYWAEDQIVAFTARHATVAMPAATAV